MRFRIFIIVLVMGLWSIPAFAQESTPHRVTVDGFSFSYDETLAHNVNIWRYPGDPVEGSGRGFSDAANTVVNLFDAFPAPESPLDAKAGIRVYAVSDLAKYDFMQAEVDSLQALIDGTADLSSYETHAGGNTALPYLPTVLHGQILRTHTQLVDTGALKGVSYLTLSPALAAIEPFNNASFLYVFQGISADGKTYISASFPVTTTLYPAVSTEDITTVSEAWDAYLADGATFLDAARASDFSPSLDTIDSLIQSFAFQQS